MRGHEHITTMRLQGATPRAVFVDCDTCQWQSWRTWHTESPSSAQVEIEPMDVVAGLDLRFSVGLTVIVSGSDHARVQSVARAFERSGASRVVAATVQRDGAEFETTSISDTAAKQREAT